MCSLHAEATGSGLVVTAARPPSARLLHRWAFANSSQVSILRVLVPFEPACRARTNSMKSVLCDADYWAVARCLWRTARRLLRPHGFRQFPDYGFEDCCSRGVPSTDSGELPGFAGAAHKNARTSAATSWVQLANPQTCTVFVPARGENLSLIHI